MTSTKTCFCLLNDNGQLPYYCLQEMNWILNKRRPPIKAELISRKI